MKQTAVEWLREKLWSEFNFSFSNNILEQAKAIEKEQIVDAFDNGFEEWTPVEYSDGQHYYNENYEK